MRLYGGRTKDVVVEYSTVDIDAVPIHAQRGHGWRASLYSDYTFAV
jgi:hypothetical protein